MNATHLEIAVWAASVLLALFYVIAGGTKAVIPKRKLQNQQRMAYVADLSVAQIKVVGVVEVAGAIGVILPHLTGIASLLSAVAAFALAAVQVVAIILHLRRREYAIIFNLVLLVLAIVVGTGLVAVL